MSAATTKSGPAEAKSLAAETDRASRKIAMGAALGIARSRAELLLQGRYGPLNATQQAALHEIVTQIAHADALRLEEERADVQRRRGLSAAIAERRGDRPQPPTLAAAMSARPVRRQRL